MSSIGRWVIYDINNEMIIFCDTYDFPTEDELRRNFIKMPWEQAELIRHAKGLPMPCPPVKVVWEDKS